MPEHKHTPGPWDYWQGADYDCSHKAEITADSGEIVIANFNDLISEGEANARLIAAAPDLLKACIALINYDESAEDGDVSMLMAYAKATRLARAAIAKATGQA